MVEILPNLFAPWAFNAANMEKSLSKTCAAVAGGEKELEKNPSSLFIQSLLRLFPHGKDALEKLIIAAKYGVPCIYTPGMIFGGTAPMTIAGALPKDWRNSLTGLVIAQLVAPGAPIIGGTSGSPLDMKTCKRPTVLRNAA